MLETGEEIVQQWVDLMREGLEHCWPVERSKSIGKGRGAINVIDAGEDIVDLGVANAVFAEFDR
jgi:hypothetical protein